MNNKPISLQFIISILVSFFFVPILFGFSAPSGKWVVDGTYTMKANFKGKKKTNKDNFTGEKLVFLKHKKVKIKADKFIFTGKQRYKRKNNKILVSINTDKVEDMLKDYMDDNYSEYTDDFELDFDIDRKKIIMKILPDNTLDGSGNIKAQCDIILEKFGVEKKVGTIDFEGILNFTGVQQ